jgi:hypothetical protein
MKPTMDDKDTPKKIPQAKPPGKNVLVELGNNQHIVNNEKGSKAPLDKWVEESAAQDNIGGG